jgi:lipoprotein-anchoring transpeptidase ErfK/SrfK
MPQRIVRLAYVVLVSAAAACSSSVRAQTGEHDSDARAHSTRSAARGAISMIVDLGSQHAYVYRGGDVIADTAISSGKAGYRTPLGMFKVLQKQRFHRSNKYDDAPMPYMQRLTWSGLALHGGHLPGYPASHGCIRLPMKFARWLYGLPTAGMKVVITNRNRPASTIDSSQDGSAQTSDLPNVEERTGIQGLELPVDPSDADSGSEAPR